MTLSFANLYGEDSILYIRQNPATGIYASDGQFGDSLKSWGYAVKFIDQSAFEAAAPIWANYIGAFINEPVNSGAIKNFGILRDNYPVPMICFEGWAGKVANWGWLSNDDTDMKANATGTEDELSIVIEDNTHYITQIFDEGDIIEWSTNTTDIAEIAIGSIKEVNVTYTHKLARNLALESESDYWGMVAIDSSDEIPNRLFWWGLNQYALNGKTLDHVDYMTADLFKIVKRAAEWAYKGMNASTTSVNEFSNSIYNLSVFPNPSTGLSTITFNATANEVAQISLYDLSGRQQAIIYKDQCTQGQNIVNFDFETYDAGIYFIKLEIDNSSNFFKVLVN